MDLFWGYSFSGECFIFNFVSEDCCWLFLASWLLVSAPPWLSSTWVWVSTLSPLHLLSHVWPASCPSTGRIIRRGLWPECSDLWEHWAELRGPSLDHSCTGVWDLNCPTLLEDSDCWCLILCSDKWNDAFFTVDIFKHFNMKNIL